MVVLKCKMCGGDLNIIEGVSTAECEFCGSIQTIPKVDDEKKLTLFARANRLRAACEFDKAAGIYETIIADFPEEAEAYWGLVLCKYGIEYVDDPGTAKKIPTCHRSSFESIMEDSDFEQTLENADGMARRVYREEAKQIEELRKGIIAVSANEEPYDVFICYKETDESGNRTIDSVLAQDVYDALTDKGYRVFFSRITLEDKLGVEYEPYIFAALNSAKIMLAFGTDYEYFNAVWVKNEWSRFLKLMAKDKSKHLIPCYKGIDAYDMPKEFARLQAQDLGKIGATQDLFRGIEKIFPKQVHTPKETIVVQQATDMPTIAPLLKRAFMFLEDGDWVRADEYCEKVLDINPECAEAYLGKLLASKKLKYRAQLGELNQRFDNEVNYSKTVRYGSDSLINELDTYLLEIDKRLTAIKAANKEAEVRDQRLQENLRVYKEQSALIKAILTQEEKLVQIKQDYDETERYLGSIVMGNISEMNPTTILEAQGKLKKEKTRLQDDLSNLGFFAGKEKKTIREKIQNVEKLISLLSCANEIATKIEELRRTLIALNGPVSQERYVAEKRSLIAEQNKDKGVFAPLPGIVQRISVRVNQRVKEGDTILFLSALGFENEITAPFDGIVKAIVVSEGSNVETDDLLVAFDK